MNRIELRWMLLGAVVGVFIAVAPSCACGTQCSAENCSGCCSDNTCLDGNTAAACGAAGGACAQCTDTQTCTDGSCVDKEPVDSGIPNTCTTDADCVVFADQGLTICDTDVNKCVAQCVFDDDCAYKNNGSVCDAEGRCVVGNGCNDDSQCQSPNPADPCYQYGKQCRCAIGDAPVGSGLTGTCRRRLGPCQECTQDAQCGVGIVFGPPDGIGEGRCKTLMGDTSGKKYCLYQRVGQCPCGTIDDGTGYCKPQNNSCDSVGCQNDRNCPSGSVCTANLPEDAGAGACGGICVPRCRWDFLTGQLAAPGCPPGTTCWVDNDNLDPASIYYGSGRCKPPCNNDQDCQLSAANPFGGPKLKCAGENLPGGGVSEKRCRANGECMDDAECPEAPPNAIALGYCDRGNFTCETDCRTGSDPVTGKPYRDCRTPYACAADAGTNYCRLLTCKEQGGAAIACRRGEYCCGEDKNQDGVADPCPPPADQDPAGCYTAPAPPFCTECQSADDCKNVQLPSWLSGASACANGSKSPSCSPLPMACMYAGDRGMSQGINICAPSTWNDNTQDNLGVRVSQRGCPAGYSVNFLRPDFVQDGENFCTTDDDCNQGADGGHCAEDFTSRKADGGYRKACLCTAGSGLNECPNVDGGVVSQCKTGVTGQTTYCITTVVCMPGPGIAYYPPGDPQFGCGL